jgi:3'-5' exoribonuclease
MVVRLEDATGGIVAYCWQGRYHGPPRLSRHDIVHVVGTISPVGTTWVVKVKQAEVVGETERSTAHVIPAVACSRQDLLENLARVVAEISFPALQGFVKRVLSDNDIAGRFVTVPASVNHHHSYPSGTLDHSLECVDVVRRMPDPSDDERAVAMVAALFHDIGKIRTNTIGRLTSEGHWIHHNVLTLEVLADHLKRLDLEWPEAGRMLRHIWSSLHGGPTQPRSSLATLVRLADQYSAARAQDNAAFTGQEMWKTNARDAYGRQKVRLRNAA